ncbi:MAG: cell division protein ZapA [Bacteroidia bacterium]|nr:cell division protein ZapA [Bacteroidia bacterium]
MNELSIKVNIADRYYPLKVTPEQEEIVRQAAKLINDKLKALQQQFEVKDKQDMLSMTVLEIATQLITLQNGNLTDNKELQAQLQEMRALLIDVSV